MEIFKPDLKELSEEHLLIVNDIFESLWVEYVHSQKYQKKRSSGLRRNDTLKIRNIDGYLRYPVTKEITRECLRLNINIPKDNRINHSIQMRINRELKKLNYPNRLMIEHIGGGVKDLLSMFENQTLDFNLEIGVNQVKQIYLNNTFSFYRFEKGVKENNIIVNRSTSFKLDEAIKLI